MSAMRTHAAFENNFVSISDKHAPKKTKILQGNQNAHFNRNLRQISQKTLVALSSLSHNETCW